MCKRRGAIRLKRSRSFPSRHPRPHQERRTINLQPADLVSNNRTATRSNHTMKKFSVFPLIVAMAFFVSCQKQQTEEERKAEVERQVQDRLAAERMEAEKLRLAQQQTDLDAREKALANRETASPTPVEERAAPPAEEVVTETADDGTRAETQTTAAYGMFYEK